MGIAASIRTRSPGWMALLALACGGIGIAAGNDPKLGLAAAFGLAFSVAVLSDVTLGLMMFTVLCFLDVINFGGASVSFMKIVGLLLFLSWFASMATQRDRDARALFAEQPVIAFAAIGLVGWSLVSVAWAESTGTAISSSYRFLLDILLLPIVSYALRKRVHFVWILAAFVFGAVVSASLGVFQSGGARLLGGIGDSDDEAAVLVAALALVVGLWGVLPRGSAARLWTLVGATITLLGLVDTGSRGGLVAFGCMLVAAVLFGGRWRGRALVLLIVAASGTGLYLTLLAPSSARQHINSTSSTGRTDLWKVGVRMWEANPLVGVGAGNFANSAIHYVQGAGPLTRADLIVDVPHVTHNTYLQMLDELGIPGLIAFMTLSLASISAAIGAARRYERAGDVQFELLSRALALAIIGLMSADFFISNEYERLLWLLLAIPIPLLALARSETGR